MAKEIARVFKERVYQLAPDVSPEQVLINIAEKEFGLVRLELPESARAQIVQRLDAPSAARPAGRPARSERSTPWHRRSESKTAASGHAPASRRRA